MKKEEKAPELPDHESGITLSAQDFQTFAEALNRTFIPNVALQNALHLAQKVKRAEEQLQSQKHLTVTVLPTMR